MASRLAALWTRSKAGSETSRRRAIWPAPVLAGDASSWLQPTRLGILLTEELQPLRQPRSRRTRNPGMPPRQRPFDRAHRRVERAILRTAHLAPTTKARSDTFTIPRHPATGPCTRWSRRGGHATLERLAAGCALQDDRHLIATAMMPDIDVLSCSPYSEERTRRARLGLVDAHTEEVAVVQHQPARLLFDLSGGRIDPLVVDPGPFGRGRLLHLLAELLAVDIREA